MTTTYQHDIACSFRTITEMIRDRGTPDNQLHTLEGDDILAIANGKQVFHIDDVQSGYRIIYEMSPRFRLVNIRKLLDPPPENIRVFIVVVRNCPTSPARSSVLALGLDVEFFDIRELQYNVSKHVLVPKHEPIREEAEINAILEMYDLKTPYQLPSILTTDPMTAYLALKPGQLVRITRNSPTAGVTIVYRCCRAA
jgi:DNA-directed RNA polymerase subunit H (RpoH/RPB5)